MTATTPVDVLISTYKNNEITSELYQFGKMLIDETERRTGTLDSKANTLLGFSAAVLAFLLTRIQYWPNLWTLEWFVLSLSIIAAGAASIFAFNAVRARKWKWFSERVWFKEQVFDDPENLRRYYLRAMYLVEITNAQINASKAKALVRGQACLAAAAVLLALELLVAGPLDP